jgi:hypothetical protein
LVVVLTISTPKKGSPKKAASPKKATPKKLAGLPFSMKEPEPQRPATRAKVKKAATPKKASPKTTPKKTATPKKETTPKKQTVASTRQSPRTAMSKTAQSYTSTALPHSMKEPEPPANKRTTKIKEKAGTLD